MSAVHHAPDGTAWERHGEGRGAPLVLIHGLGLSRAMWRDHLPALAERHEVVAYDLHGHGESAPAPDTPTLALFARQMAGVMDHAGLERAHVVGFSIGGMINRRFALDHSGRARTLAILNSPHERGAEAQAAVEERARRVNEGGAAATLDAALERWFTPEHRTNGEGPTRVRRWRDRVDAASYAGAAWVLAHGVRELVGREITVPTLVMTCENDSGSTPAMSEAIAREARDGELAIVPRLRHLGIMEEPALFTAPLLRFLERHA